MRPDALLDIDRLESRYGAFQALSGVSLYVGEGETVAVIGANGAGKSTLLRSIAGLAPNAAGEIRFRGAAIRGMQAHRVAALGVALAPEGRRLFPSLSLEENLLIGGRLKRRGLWSLETVYDLFPSLRRRRESPVSVLSGGERQMAAIGRALMSNPSLLLIDEASLGLAPIVVKDLYAAIPRIKAAGASLMIVEQNIAEALKVADRVYCLQEGRVSLEGAAGALSRDAIAHAYFGN